MEKLNLRTELQNDMYRMEISGHSLLISDCSPVGLYYEDRFNIFDPVIYYSNHSDNQYTYKEVMRYRFRAIKQSDVLLVNLNNIDIETSDDILYAYLNNVPVIAFSDSNSNIDDQKIEQIDRVEIGKDALTKVMMHVAGYF